MRCLPCLVSPCCAGREGQGWAEGLCFPPGKASLARLGILTQGSGLSWQLVLAPPLCRRVGKLRAHHNGPGRADCLPREERAWGRGGGRSEWEAWLLQCPAWRKSKAWGRSCEPASPGLEKWPLSRPPAGPVWEQPARLAWTLDAHQPQLPQGSSAGGGRVMGHRRGSWGAAGEGAP